MSCSPPDKNISNGCLVDGFCSHMADLSALHTSSSAAAVMGEGTVDDLLGDYGMTQQECSCFCIYAS